MAIELHCFTMSAHKSYRWIFLVLGLSFIGCTSAQRRPELPKAITLEFKGKSDAVSDTRYFSNAHILTYEDHQLLRDRQESVDFTVTTHVSDYDGKNKILKFDEQAVSKDGTASLHDLAFPEMGERLDYEIRSNGEVLRVGNLPPESLYYVPSLPIPDHAVEVGDTWPMDHIWLSAKDGIPLQLRVVGILKAIVPCEGNKVCADLEISGNVVLVKRPTAPGTTFTSRVWGRLLFSLERGDVLWSEMRSQEVMDLNGDKMDVTSCMVSELKVAAAYHIPFACDPTDTPVAKVPTL
jgi:hypothetical protein